MNLNSLPKLSARKSKRLGRGLGSGKGKTGGRGQKGQKARGKIPEAQVGAGLILYKKLPFKRGWGNRKAGAKPTSLTLDHLNSFKAKSVVNIESLITSKLLTENQTRDGVKILNRGEIKVALQVNLPTSAKAKVKIEKAGGSVV